MADPTVYADRYEIVREIARGGMATVYLARDTKLGRPVALKVLAAELSRDPAFVERFRLEAQAAAGLNEPTIVSVYDWGQEQGTSFIVMEYVEGRTLRDDIAGGPLDAVAAATIGAAIAQALSAAHRAGVVHRDVKPGNVLLTPNDDVTVTDFGIARANGTGDGLTRTGAVMGTATYFSPEQAQGLPVDARSDIYSLGVVLYEMVTSRVPFVGDSAVSVAYRHVREEVVPPGKLRVDLPEALERIILTCLQKDPEARYQSADALRADLLRFVRGQAIVGGPATAAVVVDADATQAAGRTTVAPVVSAAPPRRRSRGPVVLVIAFLVALIAVVAFLLVQVFRSDDEVAIRTVPDVVGLTESAARTTLEGRGFDVKIQLEANQRERGIVFDQNPREGEKRPTGTDVTLFVSDGTGFVKVPKLAGKSAVEAVALLTDRDLIATTRRETSETVPRDRVIRTEPPAGARLQPGDEVIVVVSDGPAPIAVPDVTNLTQGDATQRLVEAGFRVRRVLESSRTVDAGLVIRTDPAAGAPAQRDSEVTIFVSSGARQVDVPNVVGMSESEATAALRGAGLEVDVQTVQSPGNVGRVISQNPGAGTRTDEGTVVVITVGAAPPTTTTTSSTTTTTTTAPPGP
jgi:serine/threonine-protein kinase